MDKISFEHIKQPEKKRKVYRFQETCKVLADLTGMKIGLMFALWKKVGTEIYQIEAEIKQGEIKNPKVYILWKLKNNNNYANKNQNKIYPVP